MAVDYKQQIEECFNALPDIVQKAIASGQIQEKFQELAKKHNLHLDEWQHVQNQIMLTVLGINNPEELVAKVVAATNIGQEKANALIDDVAITVFKPIREELERSLGHPQATEEQTSNVEKLRNAVLATHDEQPVSTTTFPPLTTPKNEEKVARAPASGAYKPGETSVQRADVHDDPYREPPL